MLFFGLTCALICAGVFAGLLAVYRRALSHSGVDKDTRLYQRFIDELSQRESRGEVTPDLAREERAEAARALLRSGGPAETLGTDPKLERWWLLGLGAVIALGGMGVYLLTGTPGAPDQPYAQRLEHWDELSQKAPESLTPPEMAAVLRQYQVKRADDPRYWGYMAEADLAAQNFFEAVRDLETLVRLQPNSANAWTQLGMAHIFAAEGKSTPAAKAAFTQALRFEPRHVGARYFLARIATEAGDFPAAHGLIDGLMRDLDARDPRREAVAETASLLAQAEESDRAVKAQIAGMVGNLSASLAKNPENPDGWARLLRSYKVLGDKAKVAEIEASIRKIYADRPEQAAEIMRKSKSAVGTQQGS